MRGRECHNRWWFFRVRLVFCSLFRYLDAAAKGFGALASNTTPLDQALIQPTDSTKGGAWQPPLWCLIQRLHKSYWVNLERIKAHFANILVYINLVANFDWRGLILGASYDQLGCNIT
jgi:hypothetical protein